MDSSMVSLQARFSSLFLLRCAGLRLRLGAERFRGLNSTTRMSGEGIMALSAAISMQQLRAMEVMSSVMTWCISQLLPAESGWRCPRFDPACAECYVAVCGVPVDTSHGCLSTAGIFPGLTFAVDVVVEIVHVRVAVVVVVVSQSQRASSPLSVCTVGEH